MVWHSTLFVDEPTEHTGADVDPDGTEGQHAPPPGTGECNPKGEILVQKGVRNRYAYCQAPLHREDKETAFNCDTAHNGVGDDSTFFTMDTPKFRCINPHRTFTEGKVSKRMEFKNRHFLAEVFGVYDKDTNNLTYVEGPTGFVSEASILKQWGKSLLRMLDGNTVAFKEPRDISTVKCAGDIPNGNGVLIKKRTEEGTTYEFCPAGADPLDPKTSIECDNYERIPDNHFCCMLNGKSKCGVQLTDITESKPCMCTNKFGDVKHFLDQPTKKPLMMPTAATK